MEKKIKTTTYDIIGHGSPIPTGKKRTFYAEIIVDGMPVRIPITATMEKEITNVVKLKITAELA